MGQYFLDIDPFDILKEVYFIFYRIKMQVFRLLVAFY
jgi:hypothetical protein